MKRLTLLIALMLMLAQVSAFAQISAIPQKMNFSGQLANSDGSITGDKIANGAITANKFPDSTLNPLAWLLNGNTASGGHFTVLAALLMWLANIIVSLPGNVPKPTIKGVRLGG